MNDQPCRLVTNLIILLANKSLMSVKTERSSQNQSISTPLNPTLLFDGTLGSNRLPVQTWIHKQIYYKNIVSSEKRRHTAPAQVQSTNVRKWFKSGEENATIEGFFLIWSIDFIETSIFSLPFAVIAILSNLSWVLRSPQEKLKTLWLYKILGNFGWLSEILAFEATLKFE